MLVILQLLAFMNISNECVFHILTSKSSNFKNIVIIFNYKKCSEFIFSLSVMMTLEAYSKISFYF